MSCHGILNGDGLLLIHYLFLSMGFSSHLICWLGNLTLLKGSFFKSQKVILVIPSLRCLYALFFALYPSTCNENLLVSEYICILLWVENPLKILISWKYTTLIGILAHQCKICALCHLKNIFAMIIWRNYKKWPQFSIWYILDTWLHMCF